MNSPTVGSLFSGIGGIDLGLQRAGWTIAWQVENDPFCQAVLAKHWPVVPRWADIEEVNPVELPRVDLVTAGFPCQPVSLAGRGHAQDDPRWLWPHVVGILRVLRPRWVLLENVPGLLTRGMGHVLGDLAALGYDTEWECISAADVGASHLRERVWIVADAESHRRREGRAELGLRQWVAASGRGGSVADGHGQGLEVWCEQPAPEQCTASERSRPLVEDTAGQGGTRRPAGSRASSGSGALGLPVRSGGGVAQPVLGRVPDGLPDRLDRHWPAPPGTPQHSWEPPRTVGRGVPNRARRVGALGNAVVPQIVETVGRAILAADP